MDIESLHIGNGEEELPSMSHARRRSSIPPEPEESEDILVNLALSTAIEAQLVDDDEDRKELLRIRLENRQKEAELQHKVAELQQLCNDFANL